VKVAGVAWQDYTTKKIPNAAASGSISGARLIGSSDLASIVASGGVDTERNGWSTRAISSRAPNVDQMSLVSFAMPWHVETRLLATPLATLTILTFLFAQTDDKYALPVALALLAVGANGTNYGGLLAGSVAVVPRS
jgi:hypothetical protein